MYRRLRPHFWFFIHKPRLNMLLPGSRVTLANSVTALSCESSIASSWQYVVVGWTYIMFLSDVKISALWRSLCKRNHRSSKRINARVPSIAAEEVPCESSVVWISSRLDIAIFRPPKYFQAALLTSLTRICWYRNELDYRHCNQPSIFPLAIYQVSCHH
jgi:hypothetical protein